MQIVSNPRSNLRRLRLAAALAVATAVVGGLAAVPAALAGGIGPDVTVYDLYDTNHYGPTGDVHAYSVATRSCNQGDTPLNWCDEAQCATGGVTTHDHPVIAQNLYRLSGGRLTQIGMSWLKHGFTALQQSQPGCGNGTCQATSPHFLGVGCTDPYNANLNGGRPLGLRSEVDATTGAYPFPYTQVPFGAAIDQRIQVLEADLDPTLNPGARYWVEGQYIAPDDAGFGNGLNNASHREVSVNTPSFSLSFVSGTVQELPAIAAWKEVDPLVETTAVNVPGAIVERFDVARKVTMATSIEGSTWHYEYAIHNLNSDRSANSFTVDFPGAASITNAGFHAVNHHSGEPYAATPWTIDTSTPGQVTWSTDTFATDPNANALRWATTFSFWFDADAPPGGITNTLGLFKPGTPTEVDFYPAFFEDGFESGDTSGWTATVGN